MAKGKSKLPIAPFEVPNPVDISIGDEDWRKLESACRHSFSADVRQSVLDVTQEFAYFDQVVQLAESPDDTKAILNACRKAARKLQQTLTDHAFKSSDAAEYARMLINSNFQGTTSGKPLDTLFDFLGPFRLACAASLRELRETRGFEEGAPWRAWILNLAEIWDTNEFKVAARKDLRGDDEGQSAFVVFVREIQKCLPAESKIPYADSALPSDIYKALKSSGQ